MVLKNDAEEIINKISEIYKNHDQPYMVLLTHSKDSCIVGGKYNEYSLPLMIEQFVEFTKYDLNTIINQVYQIRADKILKEIENQSIK